MGGDGSGGGGAASPGLVLWGTFDRRSKAVEAELAAFTREVWALEQAVAPGALEVQLRVRGEVLELSVLQVRSSG